MKIQNQKQKKVKTFEKRVIDKVPLFPLMIFPVWMFALMYTSGISGTLFLIALCSSLLLLLISKLVWKFKKGKTFFYIAIAVSVCAWIVFYMPTVLLMSFSHTKLLYELKRADYIYSVHINKAESYKQWLPEKLPEVCEDYWYRTYGTVLAQDYSPSSYLMFHTDTETLDSYAAHFEGLGFERRKSLPEDEYGDHETDNSEFKNDLEWFCGQMRLRRSFQDNLDNAELYWFKSTYPKVVLLNYETGLVAIMT